MDLLLFFLCMLVAYCKCIILNRPNYNDYQCNNDYSFFYKKFSIDQQGPIVPSQCENGRQLENSLCYLPCPSGYSPNGPYCWEICKSGYVDTGAFCMINADVYSKDCCCILGNCCKNCKQGYRDDGCTCFRDAQTYAKKTYYRGNGVPMVCPPKTKMIAALCYPDPDCPFGLSLNVGKCEGIPYGYPGYPCTNDTPKNCVNKAICLGERVCECPIFYAEFEGECIVPRKCTPEMDYQSCIEMLCFNSNLGVMFMLDAINDCKLTACVNQDLKNCLYSFYEH